MVADFDVHAHASLHSVQNVQPPPAPRPLHGVGGIGNVLQLVENKARHDQVALQKTGVRNVGDPAVNDDAGVDDANIAAVLLLAQTEKTELFDFLGPDQKAEIGHDARQQRVDPWHDLLLFHDVADEIQAIGHQESDHQADDHADHATENDPEGHLPDRLFNMYDK